MNPLFEVERKEMVLIIVDVQEALMNAMDHEVRQRVIQNIQILITVAGEMGIPIVATEQYPKGLGRTIPEIKKGLEAIQPITKISFSCCGVEAFNEQLEGLRETSGHTFRN